MKRGNPNGNPHINEINQKTRFTSANAKAFAEKSHEARRKKKLMFQSLRALVDEQAPEEMLPPGVVEFWKRHGVPKDSITPIMAETTPIYADAINARDLPTLATLYRLYGVTFESTREHNVNVAVGNAEDKAFEIKYVVGGKEESPRAEADGG